jgi:hypothetical protein
MTATEKLWRVLLKPLCQYEIDGFKKERPSYIKLRGEKSEEKCFIMNK